MERIQLILPGDTLEELSLEFVVGGSGFGKNEGTNSGAFTLSFENADCGTPS